MKVRSLTVGELHIDFTILFPRAHDPSGLWQGSCLVPTPQYYASVIRFGSRGPGRKVQAVRLRYVTEIN